MTRRLISITSLCIFLGIGAYWYTRTSVPPSPSHTINIVCTTSIIADTVKTIGGEHISVNCLMGPGIDPHVYRARERDVHTLANADIIFYHGLHLEGKMAHVLSNMQNYTTSVAVADAVPQELLIIPPDSGDQHDPHIWFDVSLWIYVAQHIGNTLAAYDPTHAAEYRNRTQEYIEQLQKLHTSIKDAMHRIPANKRIIVTAHDAFSYFGKAYGCSVVGLQGISTESEAGIADITNLVDYIINHQVPVVFVESSVSPKAVHALSDACAARGWQLNLGPTLYTDALGEINSPAGTYLAMMRYTLTVFVQELST
ncbi:MAG: metal ABC transporter solute-binding protein, Zn/Mn family [Candidatus Babeliales bacterium]